MSQVAEACNARGRAPSRHRHRVGPRARRPPLGAGLQRARHERDPRRPDPRGAWPTTSTRSSSSSTRPTRASRARTSRRRTTTRCSSRKRRSPPSTSASSTSRRGRASSSSSGRPARSILKIVRDLPYVPDELEGLEKQLSDTYYCNFSLFQSLPDHWAVRQLFPTMPDPPPEQAADAPRRPRRPHLRQRRQDGPVHRPARRQALPRAAPPERRAVLHRRASWSAPTRRSWATSTTSSATPTPSTSGSTATTTGSSTWSRATR